MRIFFLNIFLLSFISSCQLKNENTKLDTDATSTKVSNNSTDSSEFSPLPTSTTNAVYEREGYTFSYAEAYEQSEWVAYLLEDGKWKYSDLERPLFEQDPLVKTESAHWGNYKKSGYTKGHLCPAGDRKQSQELYEETFFTSNASPQLYDFNAGVWNRLENKVRYWAGKYDGVYVVTGGVLTEDLETIGREEVAVPKYFYKVLLTKDKTRMIAFLVPHEKSNQPLYEFVVSVDELEQKTGIDFFPKLNDASENKLEASKDYKGWSF
ncbi:DNA/RNA non-specific endonuclease [Flavobacterium difficile]|uniref:DNA/RNA non-specific endonuclease n=1 Tax=Flavobacterium difficile TaxID=2709659 RepID=A0ABX0I4K1_9FLAO|nr:DNA/RNA non-specific endonuclease [Flavobacterium difficile]NHM00672.1 DNA/RNA non-specific endonuclease [Flavobacterium difficile]